MPTLYVENVPEDLYESLRSQAKRDGKSIAAQVIELLRRNVPTEAELARRSAFYEKMIEMSNREPLTPGPHPSAQEMLREDRER